MKHKVAELEGTTLDIAVAKAAGLRYNVFPEGCAIPGVPGIGGGEAWKLYSPSSAWADGGPIIDREQITPTAPGEEGGPWHAYAANKGMRRQVERLTMQEGPTALIAAMRAYVASRFGEEVELP